MITIYVDSVGRKWLREVPEGEERYAEMGIELGPPSLKPLGLPEATEIRLHNQLVDRGLVTADDIRSNRQNVLSAIQSALKVDVDMILELFLRSGHDDSSSLDADDVQSNGTKPKDTKRVRKRR